ncbi:MAG: HU family DNA-binding protein, partial [Muribaculaceae bacterium]|nr:HU family DNA-binding protein [Muribaculaceae bacterium]
MNNKITMPALVALLALKSGLTKEKSEEFLKEFFKLISDTLREGDSVKIKSLGTFKIMNVETRKSVNVTNGEEIIIQGHRRIVFVASKEIAEEINTPFSMFESVELNPAAEAEIESMMTTAESQPEIKAAPAPVVIESEVIKEEPEVIKEEIIESEPVIEEPTEPIAPIEPIEPTEPTTPIEPIEPEEEQPKKRKKFIFWWGLITGLLIALLIGAAGYFFLLRPGSLSFSKKDTAQSDSLSYLNDPSLYDDEDEEEESVEEFIPDTAVVMPQVSTVEETATSTEEKEVKRSEKEEIAKTEPSDKIVKDVIGPNNFLTTMAQRHYGDFNLWPYIYEENKRLLGHPDRIKPGTEVVIPSLSKYGVDPKNP